MFKYVLHKSFSMKGIEISNTTKLYAVLLISEKPKHGYELIKEIGQKLGKRISAGQIYPFLAKMKKQGLVLEKKSGPREKKTYHLTVKGRAFSKKMISKFSEMVAIAIESKIHICKHCGCEIYKGGYTEKIKGKNLVFCCSHCARAYFEKN